MSREWEFTDDLRERRSRLVENGYECYCIHAMAGVESELAQEMNILHSDILALPFFRITHKSTNGKKTTYQKVILPGYVFLFLPKDKPIMDLKRGTIIYGFVKNVDTRDYILRGGDRRYAEWVLYSGGIIGMSQAIRVNGRVRIVSGPLFNMEGNIREYSKKNRNCRIEVTLFNRVISMWLPFQWLEGLEDDSN